MASAGERSKTPKVIAVKNLTKKFVLPGSKNSASHSSITVIRDLTFEIAQGSWTSLTGSSGSGKSTLLSLLAGLDVPSTGSIEIDGTDITGLSEDARCDYRARHMGFIFQAFRLMPTLSALENVLVPLEILGEQNSQKRAQELLERVGLGGRLDNLPSQLSGGEQQRVAIARAFAAKPSILFADEPTGNLDTRNGAIVLDLLRDLHREMGSTLIVVTHDAAVAAVGQHQLKLRDGELVV